MKAIFLDRDGVINKAITIKDRPYPPKSLQEMELIPGVEKALKNLSDKNFKLIVVTNQPDVGRGKTTINQVNEINDHLKFLLPIDEVISCFHDDEDNCECRKPKPGMIVSAAKKYSIDISQSFLIGDRWRDIEAGLNAGCKTFFIDYGYNEKQPKGYDFRVQSLLDASEIILGDNYEQSK